MIDANELPQFLEQSMPELSGICKKAGCKNPYDFAAQLIRFTREKVQQSNTDAACQCMKLAEKMYKKGTQTVKNAIENVYVYSLTCYFFHNRDEAKEISKLMPEMLLDLYRKQIIYSHL
jgi:hypothetical protein